MTSDATKLETGEAKPGKRSLKRTLVLGASWTMIGFGGSQIARLAGNLIMTRILMEEAFGIMLLLNTFIAGICLFSDLGIRFSVIQDPEGESPGFLRTVWTFGLLRGVVLYGVTFGAAWPLALFYENPDLVAYLQVAGLSMVIDALASTNEDLASRRIQLGRLTIVDAGSQILGLALTVLLVWLTQDIWALVWGSLISASLRAALSHTVLPGPVMQLRFDRAIMGRVFRFGKWILLSTALTFALGHLDRLVLGKVMDERIFGVLAIAMALATAGNTLIYKMASSLLLPVMSRTLQAKPPPSEDLQRLRKMRVRFCLLFAPPVLVGMFFGSNIIEFLYDDRYVEAGVMLEILGAFLAFDIQAASLGNAFLASGNSRQHMIWQLIDLSLLIAAMAILGSQYGWMGVLYGKVLGRIIGFGILLRLVRRYGIIEPRFDLLFAILMGLGIAGSAMLQGRI